MAGSSIHLMTNVGAAWERDGKGMPQGSGDITGVLVYETCDNFAWDNTVAAERLGQGVNIGYITDLGHISGYQIRPVTREDIALKEKFEDGFSEMIMEIRYTNRQYSNIIVNTQGNIIHPTYPVSTTPLAGNPAGNPAGSLSGTTTNQLRLIYTRTDLSMEEWRALQPPYRYQEFLTEANAVV